MIFSKGKARNLRIDAKKTKDTGKIHYMSGTAQMLPAENENNYDYLYQIKKLAEQCGLLYYSKVTWKKGEFVSNTGRKSKNTQDVMIFSKGKARNLRIDAKKTKDTGEIHYMSGTAQMLPTENENNYDYLYQIKKFAEQCGLLYYSKVTWKKGDFVSNTGKIHQSELPLGPLYSYPRIIAPL